jgi:hypothetical protein
MPDADFNIFLELKNFIKVLRLPVYNLIWAIQENWKGVFQCFFIYAELLIVQSNIIILQFGKHILGKGKKNQDFNLRNMYLYIIGTCFWKHIKLYIVRARTQPNNFSINLIGCL